MTRRENSRLLVLLTGGLVFAAAGAFAGMQEAPAPPPAATPGAAPEAAAGSTDVARGRELFRAVGCTGCHSAEGVGSRRLPLDGVGSRLSAEALRAWVVAPRSVDPAARKPAYDDLPPEDVDALVAYMESLEEEAGGG